MTFDADSSDGDSTARMRSWRDGYALSRDQWYGEILHTFFVEGVR